MPTIRQSPHYATGVAAITLAVLFNVPYAVLAVTFDYPQVLRRPSSEVLELFAKGGPALIFTWHAFALAALALTPMACALAVSRDRMARTPGLTFAATITGALAGVVQAMGLWRWVFVVPELAASHAAPGVTVEAQRAAERAFDILNQYAGVAIGEHLGQSLTALFVTTMAWLQWTEGRRATAVIGALTAGAIAIGTNEGVVIAMGGAGRLFWLATTAGFLGLTLWLIATGVGLLRAPPAETERP